MIEGIDVGATLAGAATGLIGSLVAPVMNFFSEKSKRKHELEMAKLQMQSANTQNAHEQSMYDKSATDNEHARLVEHSKSLVDGSLRSMVRPLFAFVFLGMFMAYKLFVVVYGIYQGASAELLANMVWGPASQSIFSAIILFYFGSRHFEKAQAMVMGK